jgi:hypothetical protein
MPAPIIDPTTIAVNAGRDIFSVEGEDTSEGDLVGEDTVVEDIAHSSSRGRTTRVVLLLGDRTCAYLARE